MIVAARTFTGPAADLHARTFPRNVGVEAWRLDADRPAVVLGSHQSGAVLDADACRLAGVDIARRRSGGGLVLVEPGELTWVDVLVGVGDRRWHDDLVAAMRWCGERWRRALADVGVGGAVVAEGPSQPSSLGALVCFAGVGHGEVLRGGAKLVGIAQRRTRDGARFQCMVHHRWRPDALWPLLAGTVRPTRAALERLPVGETPAGRRDELVGALVGHLAD